METKQVKGYEGLYEVNENGNVFSVERIVVSGKNKKCVRKFERKEKAQRRDKYGYFRVSLSKEGKVKAISVHRIVAMTFIEGDSKLTVNHKDGNKQNNHYSNLEFISNIENLKHAHRIGLSNPPKNKVGTENKFSKLNEFQVLEIRKSNISSRKLSVKYGVHHSVIQGIKNGTRYFNVK